MKPPQVKNVHGGINEILRFPDTKLHGAVSTTFCFTHISATGRNKSLSI